MKSTMLNRYEFERYAATTASRAGLKVVWESDPKKPPRTDGRTIWLPEIRPDFSQDQVNEVLSFCIHEVEHIKHTDFDVLKKHASANPEYSIVGAINNMLEDDNIDYKNAQEFIGDKQIRGATTAKAMQSIAEQASSLTEKYKAEGEAFDPKAEAMLTAMAWGMDNVSDFYKECSGISYDLEQCFSPDMQAKLKKLRAGDYRDVLKSLRDMSDDSQRTKEVFELSQRICKEVFEIDPDEEEEQAQQKQDAAQAGSGKGKEEGESSGSGGDGSAKGMSEGDGEEGESSEDSVVSYKTFAIDQEDRHAGIPKHNQKIIYEDRDYDYMYSPSPLASTYVTDYVKKKSNYNKSDPNCRLSGRHIDHTKIPDTTGFNNAVRRLLQIRSRDKWEYGKKRGSLHNSSLYRLTIDRPGHGYDGRVFKKRIVSDTLNTALAIMVDISGSMGGNKVVNAANAAAHLSDTIGNTLHIPCEIVGFTENACRNSMFIYRSFDCRHVRAADLLLRIGNSCHHMEQNADGDSVIWKHNRIIQRKEKRKILIVLSDGSPASSKAGDCMSYTKQIVKEIELKSPVEILGVGIQDDNVKRIYKEHYVISDSSQIEPALLNILKRKVL